MKLLLVFIICIAVLLGALYTFRDLGNVRSSSKKEDEPADNENDKL